MATDWKEKSRELAERWGWTGIEHPRMWVNPKGQNQWRPDYANDLNALLRDMPAGWWLQFDRTTDGRCTAACGPPGTEEDIVVEFEAERIEWALLDACLAAPE